jgi:hypothetical protein
MILAALFHLSRSDDGNAIGTLVILSPHLCGVQPGLEATRGVWQLGWH